MINTSIAEIYESKIILYTEKSDLFRKRLKWLMIIRLLVFSLFVYLFITTFSSNFGTIHIFLSVAVLILFLQSVRMYNNASDKFNYFNNLKEINQNELKALNFDFSPFEDGIEFSEPSHPYAYDIDLFGEGSVFQQINRSSSVSGKQTLANWLLNVNISKKETLKRQVAIKELSSLIDTRQDFIASGKTVSEKKQQREDLLKWSNKVLSKNEIRFYKSSASIISLVSAVFLVVSVFGFVSFTLLFFILGFNSFLIFLKIKKINREHSMVSKQYDVIMQYAGQIGLIEKTPFHAEKLVELQNKIKSGHTSSRAALNKLASVINAFDYRLNLFVTTVLNGLFLWDFFCMLRLNKWKQKYGLKLEQWFDVLNEFEALHSMANYYANNPGYCFAVIDNDGPVIKSKNLCHPQIPYEKRVENSIDIENKGQFMVITGPNMAGKSTYLRTVALSVVLAQCGAPVCATEFTCRNLYLFTSMRTSDSLYKNESYFFAELKRLKEIISVCDARNDVFIVLDEILKGTNSKDKAEGSKAFLRKVAGNNTTGIVATHDITLGELENEMKDKIFNFCFEADTEGKEVTFDYKLKRGITTKMNASVLMKQMGII